MTQQTLPNLMDRETIQDIRESAVAYADSVVNDHWKEAYKALALAADHVDAMIARTEIARSAFETTE